MSVKICMPFGGTLGLPNPLEGLTDGMRGHQDQMFGRDDNSISLLAESLDQNRNGKLSTSSRPYVPKQDK